MNSINTFEQMAKMFLGKYFPPSMVTKLRNEITNFRQRPDESLFEAWERYKLLIDRRGTFIKRRPEECYDLIENMTAHHNDWDTSAQRGESSSSITSSSDTEIEALKAEMAEINKNLMRVLQVNQQVKAVTLRCETCGGPHSFSDCPATVGNTQNVYVAGAYQGNSYQPQGNRNLLSYRSDNYLGPPGFNQNQDRNNQNQNFHNQNRNQGNHNPQGNNQKRNQLFQGASHGQNQPPSYQAPAYQAPVHQPQIPQLQVVTTNEFTNFMKANDAILKNMQTNMTSLTNSNLELKNMFGQFIKMNIASSSGSKTLPGNTITNPKEDLKGITTRSGTAYQGPKIPTTYSFLPPVVERETETSNLRLSILNSEPVTAPIIEPVASPVSASKPNQRPSISYPSRLHDQKLRDKANDQREKFFQIFKDLNFNISFVDALILMPKFGPTIKTLLTNKDKLSELARTPLNEHCSVVLLKKLPEKLGDPGKFLIPCDFAEMAECLALADLGASINLMPFSVWNKLSLPDLSPTCMTLELTD
nr:reverse transcriptase domain-containing protein [Tanacetum cinerariifolium]